ncbi:transketolase [Candidatus Dependentiae bacterium]|nr:transketolase [Candidatus Dependentiae bacterium]
MQEIERLTTIATRLRMLSLTATTAAGAGHPTSALSAADIVAVLLFAVMRFDPDHMNSPCNDRFILSKGHAAPLLYAAWHLLGKVSEQQLMTLRSIESPLEGHPTFRFVYAECATGSVGMGLAIGIGMGLYARRHATGAKTYVLLGDSECSEGSVWEAIQLGGHYHLASVVAIVDVNRLGQRGETLYDHDMQRMAQQWSAFGWHTLIVDGHDCAALLATLTTAATWEQGPVVVLARTVKGYGVPLLQDQEGWHGKALTQEQLAEALPVLQEQLPTKKYGSYQPLAPAFCARQQHTATMELPLPAYAIGSLVAPRKAVGEALVALGTIDESVVVLDAEVSNSTYTALFAKQFPDRFVECFIAEQAMVSIATGLSLRGDIAFAATFGAFFTRAFDQLRMAPLSHAAIRLIGTHVGVSIGSDGPSQMALEDIAMINAIPDSIILYPADATAAWHMVGLLAEYHDGIAYCRTTRNELPVLYGPTAEFTIGGLHILRQSARDVALLVAAGITVHQALKAYELLLQEGMHVAVIDLYSIKPFDRETLLAVAKSAGNLIITIEDHYKAGGIGQILAASLCNEHITVHSLAVDLLPRSGSSTDLLRHCQLDAQAIVDHLQSLLMQKRSLSMIC